MLGLFQIKNFTKIMFLKACLWSKKFRAVEAQAEAESITTKTGGGGGGREDFNATGVRPSVRLPAVSNRWKRLC